MSELTTNKATEILSRIAAARGVTPTAFEAEMGRYMLERIEGGHIELDFLDPETATLVWDETEIMRFLFKVYAMEPLLVEHDWIMESFARAFPVDMLVKHHPDYQKGVLEYEAQEYGQPVDGCDQAKQQEGF